MTIGDRNVIDLYDVHYIVNFLKKVPLKGTSKKQIAKKE